MKIVFIGSGNVAFHLAPALRKKGHKIIQIFGRSKSPAAALAKSLRCDYTTSVSEINTGADLYIVALKDAAISSFVKKLSFMPKLILHTSGSIGIDVFPKKMKQTGVLYPLQTFSKKRKVNMGTIPFCIEGSNSNAMKAINNVANDLSGSVYKMNSSERRVVHLSAVFANNFSNHMFALASEILKSKKVPFKILQPLILETAMKVQDADPDEMQTGPARRGDVTVIKQHMALLKKHRLMKDIYKILSKSIQRRF